MIVAAIPITKKQKENILCVATYVPEAAREKIPNWYEDCVKNSIKDGEEDGLLGEPGIIVRTITYPTESEAYAHKECDIVKSTAWQILRKTGLQPVEESSSEEDYGGYEF